MRRATIYAPTLREPPRELDLPGQRALARAGLLRARPDGGLLLLPLGVTALERLERTVCAALAPWSPQRILTSAGGQGHGAWVRSLARDVRSYRELPLVHVALHHDQPSRPVPRWGLLGAGGEYRLSVRIAAADHADAEAMSASVTATLVDVVQAAGLPTLELVGIARGQGSDRHIIVPGPPGERAGRGCAAACHAPLLDALAPDPAPPRPDRGCATGPSRQVVPTPGAHTVDEVARLLGADPGAVLKTLIVLLDGLPAAVLIPGDRELSVEKLSGAAGACSVVLAPEHTVREVTGAPVGFAGPTGLAVPIWADHAVALGSVWITGANAPEAHALGAVAGRDFQVARWADLTRRPDGLPCPRCGAPSVAVSGPEVLTIWAPSGATAAGERWAVDARGGGATEVVTGAIELQLAGLLGAIAEQHHADGNLRWPLGFGPVDVGVVTLAAEPGDPCSITALELAAALDRAGLAWLYDDRDVRPGPKLADSAALGLPLEIIVGRRGVERGVVEVRDRLVGAVIEIAIADVLAWIVDRIGERRDP